MFSYITFRALVHDFLLVHCMLSSSIRDCLEHVYMFLNIDAVLAAGRKFHYVVQHTNAGGKLKVGDDGQKVAYCAENFVPPWHSQPGKKEIAKGKPDLPGLSGATRLVL